MKEVITGWKSYAVEPVLFAYTFGLSISENVMTDLIVYQTCKTIPSMNISSCDILHDKNNSVEAMRIGKFVQPYAGPIVALKSVILLLFPAFLVLFLGPWSDRNGRKLLLIFPLIGEILHYLSWVLVSAFDKNSYWLLFPSIPTSLLGGYSLVTLAAICWVTDITYRDYRAWRIARLETALLLGKLIGLLTSPVIFKNWGYVAVFSTSAFVFFLILIYALYFVKESIVTTVEWKFKTIFDFSLVKELFDSVIKKRDEFDRFIVWSCILYLALYHTILSGLFCLSYLFTTSHLGWSLSDYSLYSGVLLVTYISGLLLLVKFLAWIFGLSSVAILVITNLSIGASSFVTAFVTQSWQMYLTSVIGMFIYSIPPMIRSIMSKTVPLEDIGKVFSLTTVIGLLIPMASEPLYVFVYMRTINDYPCPVWFLSTVLSLVMMFLAIVIEVKWRMFTNMQYDRLQRVGH